MHRTLLVVVIFVLATVKGLLTNGSDTHGLRTDNKSLRKEKFFPLFSLVRFDNNPCVPDSPEENGTCYSSSQCASMGGVGRGPCASGYGTCCVFEATCNSVATQNRTYFRSPRYPELYKPSGLEVCNLRVQKTGNVCQIRLDFVSMELSAPDSDGLCKSDMFQIKGVPGYPTNLCGSLTGQHMYLDYGSSDRITLTVVTDGAGSTSKERQWNIKITNIECNSLSRAPDGCLQYFPQSTGRVEMFNFPNPPHLALMDYTICVRKDDGACTIVWRPCPEIENAFLLTGAEKSRQLVMDDLITTSTESMDQISSEMSTGSMDSPSTTIQMAVCMADYITVMTEMGDRFCGNKLGEFNQIKSSSRPFNLRVKTNAEESESKDLANTGFCLMWRQEPCS